MHQNIQYLQTFLYKKSTLSSSDFRVYNWFRSLVAFALYISSIKLKI